MSDRSVNAKWLLAAFLGLGAALNYADRAAMSAVLAAVRTEFGVSDVALGLLGSVFLWSYAVGSPLAGRLADRRARRGLVLWSIGLWSAVTALMGAATHFGTLLTLHFLLGLAESLFLPAAFALIAETHSAGTRGCGVLIAGLLKREVGLDAIFAGVAGIFAIAGMALLAGFRLWMRDDIARAQQLEAAAGTRVS